LVTKVIKCIIFLKCLEPFSPWFYLVIVKNKRSSWLKIFHLAGKQYYSPRRSGYFAFHNSWNLSSMVQLD